MTRTALFLTFFVLPLLLQPLVCPAADGYVSAADIQSAFDAGDIDRALELTEVILERNPRSAPALAWAGHLHRILPLGFVDAEHYLGEAHASEPGDCTVSGLIALTRLAEGDLKSAEQWSSMALAEGCETAAVACVASAADVYGVLGRSGFERLKRIFDSGQGGPQLAGMLAVATLRYEGRLAARRVLEAAAERDSLSSEMLLVCAEVLSRGLDDEESSAEAVDGALELVPEGRLATWYAARGLAELELDVRASHLLASRAHLYESGPPVSYWMAQALSCAGRKQDAIGAMEAALLEAPEDRDVLTSLVELYESVEGYPRLMSRLRELADADTSGHACDIVLAEHYLSEGDPAVARTYARRAARSESLSHRAFTALGRSERALGNAEKGLWALHRAVELAPLDLDAYSALGEALREERRYEEELALFQEYEELVPVDPKAHHNVGIAYLDLEMFPEAELAERRALDLNPDYAVAHANLGSALLGQKRNEEAIEALEAALQMNPDDINSLVNRGLASINLGDYEAAAGSLERALKLGHDDPEDVANLARVLEKLRDPARTYSVLKGFDGLYRDSAEVLGIFGTACEETGRFEESVRVRERAAELAPDNVLHRYNLGVAYLMVGRRTAAEQQFLRVLETDPRHSRSHNNLSFIYRQERRYDRSIEHAREALELDDRNAGAYFNLGMSLAMVGREDEAAAVLWESVELAPDAAENWRALGAVCVSTHDLLCARRVMEELKELDPEAAIRLDEAIGELER